MCMFTIVLGRNYRFNKLFLFLPVAAKELSASPELLPGAPAAQPGWEMPRPSEPWPRGAALTAGGYVTGRRVGRLARCTHALQGVWIIQDGRCEWCRVLCAGSVRGSAAEDRFCGASPRRAMPRALGSAGGKSDLQTQVAVVFLLAVQGIPRECKEKPCPARAAERGRERPGVAGSGPGYDPVSAGAAAIPVRGSFEPAACPGCQESQWDPGAHQVWPVDRRRFSSPSTLPW